MARRQKVFGLPLGKKKRSSFTPRAVLTAGAGLAAVPAGVAAVRKVSGLVSPGAQAARQVSDVAETAGDFKEAVGRHSSTLGKAAAVVSTMRKVGRDGASKPKLSHVIEEHKDVAVPRSVAYGQWTQFERFPSIVKGAERVEQSEPEKADWTAKIGPSRRSWKAEITEQVPEERIAWKSTSGLSLKGVVTFHSLDDDLTRVLVEIEYTPRGPVEHVGNLLRIQRRRVRRDLRLFKHFLELRGEAAGELRSDVEKSDEDHQRSGDGGHRAGAKPPGPPSRAKRPAGANAASRAAQVNKTMGGRQRGEAKTGAGNGRVRAQKRGTSGSSTSRARAS